MSVSKRVGAFLCALALILHLMFVPLRARAFAGVLPAVAAGTVVTVFLMASGIYPYEEQAEFAEYVSDNLGALWSQYLDWRTEQSMNPPETGRELSSLTGYLTQGVVAISRNVWNTLSEFVMWVVSHFSVADNQTGAELGVVYAKGQLPVFSSAPSYSQLSAGGLELYSSYYSNAWRTHIFGASNGTVRVFRESSTGNRIIFVTSDMNSVYYETYYYNDVWIANQRNFSGATSYVQDGKTIYYRSETGTYRYVDLPEFWVNVGSSTSSNIWNAYYNTPASFSGVTADTTTVSAPAALPSNTPWAGLVVEGAGTAATVGTVEQIVQDGVTEREKPEVKVVEVELGAGTDVDTETGEVTESPVVVTPESVVPSISSLVDGTLVTAIAEAMQNKFPFSMFFDLTKLLNAFKKYPRAPVISLSFHDNFSGGDYTITVDLSPWDEVALIVRQLETMILLLGFWLNFDKFNVLNIILGQLG